MTVDLMIVADSRKTQQTLILEELTNMRMTVQCQDAYGLVYSRIQFTSRNKMVEVHTFVKSFQVSETVYRQR